MERQEILNKLVSLINRINPNKLKDANEVTEDKSIIGDLGFSSIDIIMIAIAIETEFSIEITNFNPNSLKTVKDVVDIIQQALCKRK